MVMTMFLATVRTVVLIMLMTMVRAWTMVMTWAKIFGVVVARVSIPSCSMHMYALQILLVASGRAMGLLRHIYPSACYGIPLAITDQGISRDDEMI